MTFDERLLAFTKAIGEELSKGRRDFAVYPYGMNGWLFTEFVKGRYGIIPRYILDNKFCKTNASVKPLSYLKDKDIDGLVVFQTCENPEYRDEVMEALKEVVPEENIRDVGISAQEVNTAELNGDKDVAEVFHTKCGKYSYGPLCDHWLVESVGAFCSFAVGSDVVQNHVKTNITTSPFMYNDGRLNPIYQVPYEANKNAPWFFPGVQPLYGNNEMKRITVGNDVWLGKNVTITNYANIADGAIIGANSVVTKDIPAYAIAVGAPARVIKYRYSSDEIKALLKIRWWDWSDELIRERYVDFYLSGKDFIAKYLPLA